MIGIKLMHYKKYDKVECRKRLIEMKVKAGGILIQL